MYRLTWRYGYCPFISWFLSSDWFNFIRRIHVILRQYHSVSNYPTWCNVLSMMDINSNRSTGNGISFLAYRLPPRAPQTGKYGQWCWLQRYIGDFIMVTDLRCWWQNHYSGDFLRYGGDFQCIKSVINNSNLSPTNLVSNICHRNWCNSVKLWIASTVPRSGKSQSQTNLDRPNVGGSSDSWISRYCSKITIVVQNPRSICPMKMRRLTLGAKFEPEGGAWDFYLPFLTQIDKCIFSKFPLREHELEF